MSERKVRRSEELRSAAGHVRYELEMMCRASAFMGQTCSSPTIDLPQGTQNRTIQNMALESFLLHFRNLRAFLCPEGLRVEEDDIVATDFLNDELKARNIGDASKLSADRSRLNQKLAHLSYSRDNSGWQARQMVVTMLEQFDHFLALPELPSERAKWFHFREDLADWCGKIQLTAQTDERWGMRTD